MHAPSRAVETVRFVARTYRTLAGLKAGRVGSGVAGAALASDVASMGPLYVKMAQFVSARRDALDADLADALAVVQDRLPSLEAPRVPVVPGHSFEREPIGRASIADVFRGTRDRDGARVVAKVRRRGVKERITQDLPLLRGVMATAAAANLPGARNMAELLRESEGMVLGELDFRQEARAQTEFRRLMRDGLPWVVVPRVHLASEDMLVAEYVPSRRLAEVAGPNAALAGRLMDLYMSMLDRGFVHADPHPGNIGVLPGGAIVLYDFGAMLRVDPATKGRVAGLMQASLTKDAAGVIRGLEGMGVLRVRAGQGPAVRRVVRRILADVGDVHVQLQNSPEFADSERRVVSFSQTFIYLVRTLTLIDGSCRALDPDFAYDFARWLPPNAAADGMAGFARDVAAVPSTMQTMQADMEEFQVRVVEEMEAGKRGATLATALATAWLLAHLLAG